MITLKQLRGVMPHLGEARALLLLPFLNLAMRDHGIATPLRTAAFVAQLAHESGQFRFMEEPWGPDAAQLAYEPPSPLAERLGNRQPGDGQRFKGRGPIRITGRANYQRYGQLLDVDLVGQPELAARPEVGFRTAALFWQSNGLNELADADQFVAITSRIDGGRRGIEDCEHYFARARAMLEAGFVADPPGRRRRGGLPITPPPGLLRGHEAIVEAETLTPGALFTAGEAPT